MRKNLVIVVVLLFATVFSGCYSEPMHERGFRLPDGDADRGRATFLALQCHQCHTIANIELPLLPNLDPPYVQLGGDVSVVKTYGQLVTAIVNPSHRLTTDYAEELISENGLSKMYIYNEHMTVQELTDLVMFLQPQYKVKTPDVRFRDHP